jgi:hypothetical protein
MSGRLLNAFLLVGGAAIVLNGLFGRDLRNDVEMPMTDEELADKTPPTKTARIIYIIFGGGLFVYGLVQILL